MTQVGEKHKSQAWEGTRGKLFDATSEDLWNLQKILHSKKGSLGKTYKSNLEANAKVYDLNQKTITPAFLHETFEKVGKNLGEADELFDKDFEMMRKAMLKVKDAQRYAEIAQEQVYDRREAHHRLSDEYVAAEEYLHEGSGCIRELVRDTAAATHSLSCGTNDKDCNEVKSLQDALDLLEGFLRRDTHHDDFEAVSVERSLSSGGSKRRRWMSGRCGH